MTKEVWPHLSADAMSGDETDTEYKGTRTKGRKPQPRYTTLRPDWRNPDVESWLRTLDHIHLWTRFTTDDKVTPGRFPHIRVPPPTKLVVIQAKVPIGLPQNWYSPEWLKKRTALERKHLKMKPAVKLLFPVEALR